MDIDSMVIHNHCVYLSFTVSVMLKATDSQGCPQERVVKAFLRTPACDLHHLAGQGMPFVRS